MTSSMQHRGLIATSVHFTKNNWLLLLFERWELYWLQYNVKHVKKLYIYIYKHINTDVYLQLLKMAIYQSTGIKINSPIKSKHTVDVRNPAPAGMYKTLYIMGYWPYQSWLGGFRPSIVSINCGMFASKRHQNRFSHTFIVRRQRPHRFSDVNGNLGVPPNVTRKESLCKAYWGSRVIAQSLNKAFFLGGRWHWGVELSFQAKRGRVVTMVSSSGAICWWTVSVSSMAPFSSHGNRRIIISSLTKETSSTLIRPKNNLSDKDRKGVTLPFK